MNLKLSKFLKSFGMNKFAFERDMKFDLYIKIGQKIYHFSPSQKNLLMVRKVITLIIIFSCLAVIMIIFSCSEQINSISKKLSTSNNFSAKNKFESEKYEKGKEWEEKQLKICIGNHIKEKLKNLQ